MIAGAQVEEEAVRRRVIDQGEAVVPMISFPMRLRVGYLISRIPSAPKSRKTGEDVRGKSRYLEL